MRTYKSVEDFFNTTTDLTIFFGAGFYGEKALEQFKRERIDYFCDNNINKVGKILQGIKIISFEELIVLKKKDSIKVLITLEKSEEIKKQLEGIGFNNYFVYELSQNSPILDISQIDKDYTKRLHFDGNKIEASQKQILQARLLFEDDKSKDVFDSILDFRKTKKLELISAIADDYKMQYIDADIVNFKAGDVLIDGGAFTGDTLDKFDQAFEYKKIYSFEPELENYKDLEFLCKTKKFKGKAIPCNYAVGEENKLLSFKVSPTEKGSSNISEEGEIKVKSIRLDDFIPQGEKVTFLKLDVEGFEKETLRGSKRIIEEDKPQLAICVYHKYNDLWEIPLLLKQMMPKSKFYLRHYSNYLWETVVYCIPQ